ncbi:MAG: TrkA family potassium uptake protein [Lachnospiraceae bacterium]|jgi:trk system potassium uptake protein TrkA|nr:TrkA family potassium uptake protein [Lachnospiraceae bacterium]MCX4347918.1 TrkA family potassium uptake protein [Lachnospiraceae bacterium]
MGKKEYIVIGLGQFGMSIAQTLMQNDCEVLVLDINEKRTRAIADSVTCAVTGNVMDAELLAGLGIRNFDGAVIAIGENMEASIMATMVVNELGVPHILAKAQSELHAKILRKVGADRVVLPEWEMGIRYANNMVHDNFFDAVELSPDISMMEINVRREWEGKSLKQLNMRAKYKINVIGIKSEDGFDVNPDPDEPLNANSKLVSIGRNEVLNKLAEGLI